MDEAMLIAAARLGDEDAFTELYHQHLTYVKAVGRRRSSKERFGGYVPGYVLA